MSCLAGESSSSPPKELPWHHLLRNYQSRLLPKRFLAPAPGTIVTVIDTTTNTVTATIPVGTIPHGIAVTPNGSFAYVANVASNAVSVIDTTNNTVTATVPVGNNPFEVAITPSGAFAYVTNSSARTMGGRPSPTLRSKTRATVCPSSTT